MGRSDYAMSRLFRPTTHLLCLFLSLSSIYKLLSTALIFGVLCGGGGGAGEDRRRALHPDCVFPPFVFGAGVELFREQNMGDSQLRKFCAAESAKVRKKRATHLH
jgi:hypothetical protein